MPALSTGRAALLLVAGLAGVGLVAGLVVRGGDDGHVVSEGPDAAHRFLESWEHSREATYLLEADVTRVAPNGVRVGDHLVVAQRPPDRLTVRTDGVSGLVDGRRLACSRLEGRDLTCEETPAGRGYAHDVRAQLDTLRDYVLGDTVLYVVQAREDPDWGVCYELSLARQLPAPPLGTLSVFCFDTTIGAPSLTRVERPEAIEETRTVEVGASVTDADLDPATYDHSA